MGGLVLGFKGLGLRVWALGLMVWGLGLTVDGVLALGCMGFRHSHMFYRPLSGERGRYKIEGSDINGDGTGQHNNQNKKNYNDGKQLRTNRKN